MLFQPRAGYRVFIPRGDPPAEGWPVLLFLHGAGEVGRDNLAQTTVGIGPAVSREPERFPMIIVFPQSPRNESWRRGSADAALAALEATLDEFDTDRERVLLSGISMGGYGAFYLALRQPDLFAAVVPVCGGIGGPPELAARIAHLPFWLFHGSDDDIIPVSESRVAVAALRAAGADVRYTEYPRVRHNSWDRAYAEPELVPWLLAQRRTLRA